MDFIKELERLVCRQNIKEKAQFYGFCCLNQIVLTRTETQVANRLLLIYFSFFKVFDYLSLLVNWAFLIA
jgi:ribosome biogenesis protein MAK21